MEEGWRDIEGLEGYSVSNTGNIKFNGRLRKLGLNHKGYPYLVLRGHSRLVHRLVAKAFIDNPDNLPTVNHIDGNKRNNAVSNLEWSSHSDNIRHSYRIGLRKNPKNMLGKLGYANVKSKEVFAYNESGSFIGAFGSVAVAGSALDLDGSSISKVCRGERKSAGGYRFTYADAKVSQFKY